MKGIFVASGGLVAAIGGALLVGRFPLPPADLLDYLGSLLGWVSLAPDRQALLHNVIVQIRLPRILLAVMVGAALAVSGAAFQAVFRNPLVSPGLLGVLAGAAFGAALGIVLSLPWIWTQFLACLMGVAAVALGVAVAQVFERASVLMLVLGGVLSAALFSSLLALMKYIADPYNQLPTIVHWLMGSLAVAGWQEIGMFWPAMLIGVVALSAMGRALDALAMGDDEARALGVPVRSIRYWVIGLATVVSALTVSVAGMIGWIGLIVPHIARLVVGPGNGRLLPASACLGAVFLLCADMLARTVSTAEIPIGIVTELIGIPVFLLVLHRVRKGWLA